MRRSASPAGSESTLFQTGSQGDASPSQQNGSEMTLVSIDS